MALVNIEGSAIRPKLVFFRSIQTDLPNYIKQHLQQQVDCLQLFFDVVTVEPDCDFREMCDIHEPDLALFETSVYSGPRRISGLETNLNVPRIGLFNSDAYCITRSTFISDMAEWGIDTYFSISVSLAEYMPGMAENLFTWPNFVDETVYRDYGLYKSIPVLVTGSQATHYPWRNQVSRIVAQHFPTLVMPHFGWFSASHTQRMLFGEQYARIINSAIVAPTCGTIAKEVVRKHFEIPACATILVTERTVALEAAGFVDLENCVFADPGTIVDKLDYVFRNPDVATTISRRGYELAHSRHTSRSRDQIWQWYWLNKDLPKGYKIIQVSPFGPLVTAKTDASIRNGHVVSGSIDRAILRRADALLGERRLDDAEGEYRSCLNYHFMPEPLLGLALCSLLMGKPWAAQKWINRVLSASLDRHHAADPDPVEWSYLILSLIVSKNQKEAVRLAAEYPSLRHPLLDRARILIHLLYPSNEAQPSFISCPVRPSVHNQASLSLEVWIAQVLDSLHASRQFRLAEKVQSIYGELMYLDNSVTTTGTVTKTANLSGRKKYRRTPAMSRQSWSMRAFQFAGRRCFFVKSKFAELHEEACSSRKSRSLFFLKTKLAELLTNRRPEYLDFTSTVMRLWQSSEFGTTLIIGEASDANRLLSIAAKSPYSRNIVIASECPEQTSSANVDNSLTPVMVYRSGESLSVIRNRLHVELFDAVIILSIGRREDLDFSDIEKSTFIALSGIHERRAQSLFATLIAVREFELTYFDPRGRGYAIFLKCALSNVDASPGDGLH